MMGCDTLTIRPGASALRDIAVSLVINSPGNLTVNSIFSMGVTGCNETVAAAATPTAGVFLSLKQSSG
jgi:hypothetical protein